MAEAKKPTADLVRARVLVTTHHDGTAYRPNEIIEAEAIIISALVKDGRADDSKEAVAYAESLQK